MKKVALIIGVNGQDGSYMCEHLLGLGYVVHGTVRRASHPNLGRIKHLLDKVRLHYGDLTDAAGLVRLVRDLQPDEIYNLGAMSDVRTSFDIPHYTGTSTALGALNVLEAVRFAWPYAKFYQAGSSEMFGTNPEVPSNELTGFEPASPYAAAKVYAHHMTTCYREAYNLFAVNGILFNHESERRGAEFVTQKIALGVAAVYTGRVKKLSLGNLHAKRDWGYAPEFVAAMHLMMQHQEPSDFVVATGETHSVVEFLERAFDYVSLDWRKYVDVDPKMMRPLDVPLLLGDASKAKRELGWEPTVKFDRLVKIMVKYALDSQDH